MKSKIVVQQDPESPVEPSVLAQAIVDLSAAVKKLSASGLNRKAIITLAAQSTQLPQGTVRTVLDSLETLGQTYTTLK